MRCWILIAVVGAACAKPSSGSNPDSGGQPDSSAITVDPTAVSITHVFDFASEMPPHLAMMFSMSWFGIPASDPQGAGPDPSYGNSKWGGGMIPTNDPATCTTCLLEGASDVCLATGASQRKTASRRRMLAGMYSASALDDEGLRRTDLMLSQLRRPCDDGAKLDAWTVQMNGTRGTALHPDNPQCATCNISYQAMLGFLDEADAAGLTGIVPGDDATWYFHFGTAVGLGTCDDSAGNPKQHCIDALTQDLVDMARLAVAHPSALVVGGKPVLFVYLDPAHLTPAQWHSILQDARDAAGRDFYIVGAIQNATKTAYFSAFDVLAPWIQLDWTNTSGTTVRQHAYNWTAALHDPLIDARPAYPGRVVFGAMTPGFDDYTMSWGQNLERQLPPGDPRDPELMLGEFDYFATKHLTGLVGETWDDWTEGSHFEPDVAGSTSVLVSMRQQLGNLFGEPADPAGDQRLVDRWTSYGQARNCGGGTAAKPPAITLTCN